VDDDDAADAPADNDDAAPKWPMWIPDVVSLGTMGSGSAGGDMADTRSLSGWVGW
jgi:hypothetical protein